jgi:hypothetical protein
MAIASQRLRRRIARDFPEPETASAAVDVIGAAGDSERVQAAVLLCGRGDLGRLRDAAAVAERDWRDVLVGAGLAGEDWPSRLDAELGG